MCFTSFYVSPLTTHMKTHNAQKAKKCNQCDYATSREGDLRKHLKTHSGEKPNKCNHCDYASSRAGDLRRHLTMHNEKI